MKPRSTSFGIAVVSLLVAALGAWRAERAQIPSQSGIDRILLLTPDAMSLADPRVTLWTDAGREEGLHVVPVHDSTFLGPLFGKQRYAGVILPDSMHVQASDLFVEAIRKYVANGGHLMLVYDGGLKSLDGFLSGSRSRLSDLAGIDYALYDQLRGQMIRPGDVSGTIQVMQDLGVPPGKYYPLSFADRALNAPDSPEESADPGGVNNSNAAADSSGSDRQVKLRDYKYGDVEYPSFVTAGDYNGQVLLRSNANIAAGYHDYGKGSVLFVNIPLGYLGGATDALPLHGFLKFFASRMLALPYMTPVPDAVGGLVLDWHIDSNAAIQPLQELNTWGILQQGPFSIDITAGPDTYQIGDKQGFDVLHNPVSQDLVHQYENLGYEIGSHGGWIHNYFSAHVEADNPKTLEKFLQLNKDALEQVTGKPVVEYSAPNGDQPLWVTHWLDTHGFLAYYSTGDTGMGPTQVYREGRRAAQNLWAFPIEHLDRAASFEDIVKEDYPDSVVAEWLKDVTDFVAGKRQVRLIYFHPPGILAYREVVHNWLEQTAELKMDGRFRWYTMAQMARFLDLRQKATWDLCDEGSTIVMDASAPETLGHVAWSFPMSRFQEPRVIRGTAVVSQGDGEWLVVSGEGKSLELAAQVKAQ